VDVCNALAVRVLIFFVYSERGNRGCRKRDWTGAADKVIRQDKRTGVFASQSSVIVWFFWHRACDEVPKYP